jgi:hypothetical protein
LTTQNTGDGLLAVVAYERDTKMYNAIINIGLVLAVIAVIFPGAAIVIAPDLFKPEMIVGQSAALVYILFAALDKGW